MEYFEEIAGGCLGFFKVKVNCNNFKLFVSVFRVETKDKNELD